MKKLLDEKVMCEKCKKFVHYSEIDHHHPDKKNKPKITIQLCKDCHYLEHQSVKSSYESEGILSEGYGIMPNKVLFDDELSSTAKILYVLISSLCANKGYCYANNKYLAEKLSISPTMVSINITKLEKYLSFENRTSYMRKIYLNNTKATGDIKENLKQHLSKLKGNIKKNLKHNNINNNNINNNIILHSEPSSQVNEFIALFENLNPMYKTFFANKTERGACDKILATSSLDKIKSFFNWYEKVKLDKYCPVFTKPTELLRQLGKLKAYSEKNQTNNNLINLD